MLGGRVNSKDVHRGILVLAGVVVLVVVVWYVKDLVYEHRASKLDQKVQELESQVQTKEAERMKALGERDAFKSQADALNPKLEEVQRQTDQSDAKLGNIQVSIQKERERYEQDKRNHANDPNIGVDVLLDQSCAELKRLGLVRPEDSCK